MLNIITLAETSRTIGIRAVRQSSSSSSSKRKAIISNQSAGIFEEFSFLQTYFEVFRVRAKYVRLAHSLLFVNGMARAYSCDMRRMAARKNNDNHRDQPMDRNTNNNNNTNTSRRQTYTCTETQHPHQHQHTPNKYE